MQPDIDDIIRDIRSAHRDRCWYMESRKIMDLRLGAKLRSQLGWSKDLPEVWANRVRGHAANLIKLGEKVFKDKASPDEDEDFLKYERLIMATIKARSFFDEPEEDCTKEMERLAKMLPAWAAWGAGVRGFGARGLAVIVGEAGDLSNYPKKGHLWKRMGIASIDGIRQGGLPKSASADDWIRHGYSPVRRSRMWVIGDSLIKGNRDGKYRTYYLERKAFELARDPEIAPIKAHRRAQRYMEQRLLRDLLQVWKRAENYKPERVCDGLPVSPSHGADAHPS